MNPTAVISCPRCLRQYEIDACTENAVAQCGICKATFELVVPRLAEPTESTLVLRDEVPYVDTLIGQACEGLAENICKHLTRNAKPIEPRKIIEIIRRVTSDEAVYEFRRMTADNCEEEGRYLVRHIACKTHYARMTIRSVFEGVLGGIWPDSLLPEKSPDEDGSGTSDTPLPPRLQRFRWLSGNG